MLFRRLCALFIYFFILFYFFRSVTSSCPFFPSLLVATVELSFFLVLSYDYYYLYIYSFQLIPLRCFDATMPLARNFFYYYHYWLSNDNASLLWQLLLLAGGRQTLLGPQDPNLSIKLISLFFGLQ